MKNKQTIIMILIGLLIIAVIALIVWLKPTNTSTSPVTPLPTNNSTQAMALGNDNVAQAINSNTPDSPIAGLAPSLQGTEIDCHLQADKAGKLILDNSIRPCFEYYLSQIGELQLPAIERQVTQQLKQILPEAAAAQAIDLWQRYLKYRADEAKIQVKGSNDDPDYLQQIFDAMHKLRQQYFNAQEITALFGDEMIYNQYTIDRLKILDNKIITPNQKAQQLKERFSQLPQDLQKNLEDMSKLDNLRELTHQIKERNGSPAEIRQMREQLVGAAAADRLEQLDQTRAVWQDRINQYLNQRAAILNSSQSDQDKQAAITNLRNQQFTTEAERQRAISFENFKDQGINTDKALN